MGFLFGGSSSPAPLPPAPKEDDEEIKQAQLEEQRRLRLMKGRSSTILTRGSLGEPNVKTTTLLGGGGKIG